MKVLTGAENNASVNVVKKEKKANYRLKQVQKVEQGTRNTQTYKKSVKYVGQFTSFENVHEAPLP